MRVLLIYNPTAGEGVRAQLRDLIDIIHDAGHEVRCRSSKDLRIAAALAEPGDLVAVAGADGTVVKVARRLRGRKTPITPLPLGTANNIATALGLSSASLEEQIAGWSGGRLIALDVGLARGSHGSRSFLESCGAGFIPRLLTLAANSDPPRLTSSVEERLGSALARRAVRRSPAVEVRAVLDDRDISGRYVLLEAMNFGWVGPNLDLAADADPADGLLDVVLVGESERALPAGYLEAREEGAPWPHAFPTLRGRRSRIEHAELGIHVDDKLWPAVASEQGETLDVSLHESAWFLIPAQDAIAQPWAIADSL